MAKRKKNRKNAKKVRVAKIKNTAKKPGLQEQYKKTSFITDGIPKTPLKEKKKLGAGCKCTIYNCDTGEMLKCQFNPTDLPRDRSINYSEIVSPGMAYPMVQFTSGGATSFYIDLFFHDMPYSGVISSAKNFLDDLIPPGKNKKKFEKPPVCRIAYGKYTAKFVVTKYSVEEEWRDEKGRVILAKYKLSARRIPK